MGKDNDFFAGIEKPVKVERPVRERKHSALNWVVKNNSIIFIIILLIFASFMLFVANFDFSGAIIDKAFSAQSLLLACCSYLLYINGYATGVKSASASAFVKGIYDKYHSEISTIRHSKVEWQLEPFCTWYKKDELRRKRTEILMAVGFKEQDVENILKGVKIDVSKLTEEELKAYNKAKNLKPIKLNKTMITSPAGSGDDRNPIRSNAKLLLYKWGHFAIKAIATVVSCAFIVSISVDIITQFSLITVIVAIIQLIFLLVSVFGGMTLGHKSETMKAERVEDIINFIGEFWEWKERKIEIERPVVEVVEEQATAIETPEEQPILPAHS